MKIGWAALLVALGLGLSGCSQPQASAGAGPYAVSDQQTADAANIAATAAADAENSAVNAEAAASAPDNHYTATSGDEVHSPAYTSDGAAPPGASAQCRDGTYSFSEHHQGTCSHHGGVASWL